MLDITYLYQRIEFLECAVSVLLTPHQLKGIYLSRASVSDADNRFKRHKLRDYMVKFLDRRKSEYRQSDGGDSNTGDKGMPSYPKLNQNGSKLSKASNFPFKKSTEF
jgi:hypothetical protein